MQDNSTLLVIASYPPKGEKHSKAIVGGAMYAKNTLEETLTAARQANFDPEIIVLAEALFGKKESYTEDGIRIKRFWRRNSPFTFFQLLNEVSRYPQARTIIIEFELVMFGDSLSLLDLPLFLLILKLQGKRIVFVFHQVLANVSEIAGHLNLPEKSFKTSLFNFLYQSLCRLLLQLSSEIIVFEEVLRKRLHALSKHKKITVIPFGTEIFPKKTPKEKAREMLKLPQDSFIAFSFGFIAWYKGTDWLVNDMPNVKKHVSNIQLIIGGGPNPNHLNKPFYQDYIRRVEENAKENGVMITGFIPENDLPLFFSASDIVLLPYRTLMSSSGPLSLAFSFEKPVLLSRPMSPLFETEDIQEVLTELSLEKDDLLFSLDTSFADKFKQITRDKEKLAKLRDFSSTMAKKRQWKEIGNDYVKVFFQK